MLLFNRNKKSKEKFFLEKESIMKKKILIFIVIVILIVLIVLGIKFWGKDSENSQNNDMPSEEILIEQTSETKVALPDIDIVTGENMSVSIDYIKNKGLPIILCFVDDKDDDFKSTIEKMADKYERKAVIQMVDFDLNSRLADYYEITKAPAEVFVNSDGTAYTYYGDSDDFKQEMDDNGNIEYTKHQGTLTEAQFKTIVNELV